MATSKASKAAAPAAAAQPAQIVQLGTTKPLPTWAAHINGTAAGKPNARALWYGSMLAYVGKPIAAWQQAVTAKPPTMPQRGKLAGKPEPVSGWQHWLLGNGYFTLKAK